MTLKRIFPIAIVIFVCAAAVSCTAVLGIDELEEGDGGLGVGGNGTGGTGGGSSGGSGGVGNGGSGGVGNGGSGGSSTGGEAGAAGSTSDAPTSNGDATDDVS